MVAPLDCKIPYCNKVPQEQRSHIAMPGSQTRWKLLIVNQDDLTVFQTGNQRQTISKQYRTDVSHHPRWKLYASPLIRLRWLPIPVSFNVQPV